MTETERRLARMRHAQKRRRLEPLLRSLTIYDQREARRPTGTPSKGLMQVIDQPLYRGPVPVCDPAAAGRYLAARYGWGQGSP